MAKKQFSKQTNRKKNRAVHLTMGTALRKRAAVFDSVGEHISCPLHLPVELTCPSISVEDAICRILKPFYSHVTCINASGVL